MTPPNLFALTFFRSDPPWFNETWLSKIKQNVASNKILKVIVFALWLFPFICASSWRSTIADIQLPLANSVYTDLVRVCWQSPNFPPSLLSLSPSSLCLWQGKRYSSETADSHSSSRAWTCGTRVSSTLPNVCFFFFSQIIYPRLATGKKYWSDWWTITRSTWNSDYLASRCQTSLR